MAKVGIRELKAHLSEYLRKVKEGEAVAAAEEVATSMVAEAEVRPALARRRREGRFTPSEFAKAKRDFRADWQSFLHIQISDGPRMAKPGSTPPTPG